MVRLNIPTMLLLEEKMKETLRVTTRVATVIQGRTSKGRKDDTLMAMEDSGLNKKRQFHKEYTELKKAILSLERERLAGHKARRDREEQALEEHRRAERRMKEEEMEYR
ncbi:hypothetical protein C343_00903 [Cryptococcus neoformans C23]|uniref:Uncharacterized protein n=1 Tax=Cryptococcus neoformans (strain H99 / ATCC 208821 / CBS 10515 / FGSC 9487) TaxID=235443 RepID=J9VK93_CRYN9|nr:hypothetical protein CNAG_07461 [Cryptococcus neoformans var. grubii H99]AUB22505.1 hypothetical protein CKF44_07461 [Cryptococcus neoformans var. grubii]OWZ35629.1 hypothetical protein C347_00972 [Cryptococcus neoformans var. grubii AD2-60a]OWZ47550.1 hypothetical protein C343_00903 [Cryptococcus neoformans var. grubii C23]OXC86749.1 hypothetical protein C344_00909 [Cryptococcus neoformans var. grubii AD1-7a]OXG71918.1 hypothetical protein C352_00909 [Cryptococcus neoformans var. grubii CH|eukprot:XP_012047108.1 hypothetical protein CNAG_07461 [Cryptococcus neoformans var. grubii H99]